MKNLKFYFISIFAILFFSYSCSDLKQDDSLSEKEVVEIIKINYEPDLILSNEIKTDLEIHSRGDINPDPIECCIGCEGTLFANVPAGCAWDIQIYATCNEGDPDVFWNGNTEFIATFGGGGTSGQFASFNFPIFDEHPYLFCVTSGTQTEQCELDFYVCDAIQCSPIIHHVPNVLGQVCYEIVLHCDYIVHEECQLENEYGGNRICCYDF